MSWNIPTFVLHSRRLVSTAANLFWNTCIQQCHTAGFIPAVLFVRLYLFDDFRELMNCMGDFGGDRRILLDCYCQAGPINTLFWSVQKEPSYVQWRDHISNPELFNKNFHVHKRQGNLAAVGYYQRETKMEKRRVWRITGRISGYGF